MGYWSDDIKDLFSNQKDVHFTISINNQEQAILDTEAEGALKQMQAWKTPGSDNIIRKMSMILCISGRDK